MRVSTSQLVAPTIDVSPSDDHSKGSSLVVSIALEASAEGQGVIECLAGLPNVCDDGPSFFITLADIAPDGEPSRRIHAANLPTPPGVVLREPALFELSFPCDHGIDLSDGAIVRFEISSDHWSTIPDIFGFRYEGGNWKETMVEY